MCNIIEEQIAPELFKLERCDGVTQYRFPKSNKRIPGPGFVCIDNGSLVSFTDVNLGVPFNEK